MTVAELIEQLKGMPQDAQVGGQDDTGDIEASVHVHPPTGWRPFVYVEIGRSGWYDSGWYDDDA
jgi:hypothetical protein